MKTSVLRWGMRILVLVLVLGIPFTALGGITKISSDPADAVSAATDELVDPAELSGEFVVFINTERHPDTADRWDAFFRGEDVPVIMDDISCLVCKGDGTALERAQLCQARLPANQMKVSTEDPVLVLSKGDYGKFDIILLSKELADRYGASSIGGSETVLTVDVK